MPAGACWADARLPADLAAVYGQMNRQTPFGHWSRIWEYPWVMCNARLDRPGLKVLDAGGGGACLQYHLRAAAGGQHVVNADRDPGMLPAYDTGIDGVQADLMALPFAAGAFDRVACVSVLEHTADPAAVVNELWRVLAPGGRLLLTLDVANYARHNHPISPPEAEVLCNGFGLPLPPMQDSAVGHMVYEEDPRQDEPVVYGILCLCLFADKAA